MTALGEQKGREGDARARVFLNFSSIVVPAFQVGTNATSLFAHEEQ